MQYDKPIMELVVLETTDIIRTSTLQGEGGGSGDEYEGEWSN